MTGRKNRSHSLPCGRIESFSKDSSGAYDSNGNNDDSLWLNKTAVHHQSTSIETLEKYTISVLGPDPSVHTSQLVDNCLENLLQVETMKKIIYSQQSKQSADSDKLPIVTAGSSESEHDVQKDQANNHFHFSFHLNAPVSHLSLDFYAKPLEKPYQSTHDDLPRIRHKRNIAANSKRKGRGYDEESNSSPTPKYSKRTKSRSVPRERTNEGKSVETEETRTGKDKGCCCIASNSKDTANHNILGKQSSNCRIAAVFDPANWSRKTETVKSKGKPKSKSKKSNISKNQRSIRQWLFSETADVAKKKVDEEASKTDRSKVKGDETKHANPQPITDIIELSDEEEISTTPVNYIRHKKASASEKSESSSEESDSTASGSEDKDNLAKKEHIHMRKPLG